MVDGNAIVLVKGISGSGKSTRVFLLLDYLEELGERLEPYVYTPITGKTQPVGIYSPALNLVFVGKFYEDGGVKRWQGYDSMTGRLGKAEGLSHFLLHTSRERHNVLIDGAGTTVTWRLRPLDLCGTSEFTNILHIRYDYRDDQWDEYCARIAYRSGKPPKGDCMWRKHRTFQHDYEKAIVEAQAVNEAGGNVVLRNQPYDAPVWDFGKELFTFYGESSEVCEDFVTFCKESDYIQRNSYQNFLNNGK